MAVDWIFLHHNPFLFLIICRWFSRSCVSVRD